MTIDTFMCHGSNIQEKFVLHARPPQGFDARRDVIKFPEAQDDPGSEILDQLNLFDAFFVCIECK